MESQLCFALVRTSAKFAGVAGGGSFSASSMGLTADESTAVAPKQANLPRDSDFNASHPGGFQPSGMTVLVLPLSSSYVAPNNANLVVFTLRSKSANDERSGLNTPSLLSNFNCSLNAISNSATDECTTTTLPKSVDISWDSSSGHCPADSRRRASVAASMVMLAKDVWCVITAICCRDASDRTIDAPSSKVLNSDRPVNPLSIAL
mmetsp:Transcript_7314/g.16584  ORF Transcript_7314/g.16584 Transcript_7314/m.16584 type:complete len:206 (-) Transcript_7314:1607-2224(-)